PGPALFGCRAYARANRPAWSAARHGPGLEIGWRLHAAAATGLRPSAAGTLLSSESVLLKKSASEYPATSSGVGGTGLGPSDSDPAIFLPGRDNSRTAPATILLVPTGGIGVRCLTVLGGQAQPDHGPSPEPNRSPPGQRRRAIGG